MWSYLQLQDAKIYTSWYTYSDSVIIWWNIDNSDDDNILTNDEMRWIALYPTDARSRLMMSMNAD